MRPRWRKVISDLWDNKSRTLLVVLSIAVGVFAVGMIAGAWVIISQDLGISYAAGNPANIQMSTTDFDKDLVNTVQKLDGVKEAEGRREVGVRIRLPGGEWMSLDLLANDDFEGSQINLAKALQGVPYPEDRQLVLDKKVLKELDVAIGAAVEMELADGTDPRAPGSGHRSRSNHLRRRFPGQSVGLCDL